jgi:hypothetical protein
LTFKHFAIGGAIVGAVLKRFHNQRKNNQMLAAINTKAQSTKQKGSSNGSNQGKASVAPDATPQSSHIDRHQFASLLKSAGNNLRKVGGKNVGKAASAPASSGKISRQDFAKMLKAHGNDLSKMTGIGRKCR